MWVAGDGLYAFVPSTKKASVERVEVVLEQSNLERYGRARSTMKNCGFEPTHSGTGGATWKRHR
jgi:hypothetical protein